MEHSDVIDYTSGTGEGDTVIVPSAQDTKSPAAPCIATPCIELPRISSALCLHYQFFAPSVSYNG